MYIVSWFKNKSLKAHFTVAGLVAVAGAIKFDPDVQLLLLKFCKAHPNVGSTVILAAGIIFRYSKSSPTPDQKGS